MDQALVPAWKGKSACIKKFERLGVKIVKDENGGYLLVSTQNESFLKRKKVVYGSCHKKLSEEGVLLLIKDFCFKPILEQIDEKTQENFDFLIGFAVPEETARLEEFSNMMTDELQKMQRKELSLGREETVVSDEFAPLFESVELAVDVARMSDDDVEEAFRTLIF